MEVSIIFKIGAVGILVSVLSQILKHSGREEQAFLVSFSGLLLVLFWIVPYIYELFKNIQQLFKRGFFILFRIKFRKMMCAHIFWCFYLRYCNLR